jgi:hypothetical protein
VIDFSNYIKKKSSISNIGEKADPSSKPNV